MSWVKWDVVCHPKRSGGLGVRDVRAVNISLLAKWRWRLLTEDNSLWKQVIKGKYGGGAFSKVVMGEECKPWFSSTWWRDICSIGTNLDYNWFVREVVKKTGNGEITSFWEDVWVGDVALRERFPRLFSISVQKEEVIARMWNGNGMEGWNLRWRRSLFVWELNLLNELLLLINTFRPSEVVDRWVWRAEQDEIFTVKSAYNIVSSLLLPREAPVPDQELIFKVIWKSPAPSKVAGFAWLVLRNRVPTRQNLYRRQVIRNDGETCCVFCGDRMESEAHLFLYCRFVLQIWERVFAWLGLIFSLPHSSKSLLTFFAATPGSKLKRKGLVMIWNASIWAIWRLRNKVIFENGVADSAKLLEDIQTSWKWWLGRTKSSPCLLYEWISEPVICLSNG
jgi:hypothetical protein